MELRHFEAVLIGQRRDVSVLQVRIPIDDTILFVIAAQFSATAVVPVHVHRLLLQQQPHLVGCLPFGDLLAFALAHFVELQHDAGNGELAFVRQTDFHFGLVGRWRPTTDHALFLQPTDWIASHLVVVDR